jgi:hypothetical protein
MVCQAANADKHLKDDIRIVKRARLFHRAVMYLHSGELLCYVYDLVSAVSPAEQRKDGTACGEKVGR